MNEKELREDYQKQGYADDQIDLMLGVKRDLFEGVEGLPFGCEPDEGKPFPNEHSCRLKSPGQYSRFARKNCYKRVVGKCLDFIFGIKGTKSELQAMRYNKKIWNAGGAAAHCKSKDGTFEAAGKG